MRMIGLVVLAIGIGMGVGLGMAEVASRVWESIRGRNLPPHYVITALDGVAN